jgi:hypothetical protein
LKAFGCDRAEVKQGSGSEADSAGGTCHLPGAGAKLRYPEVVGRDPWAGGPTARRGEEGEDEAALPLPETPGGSPVRGDPSPREYPYAQGSPSVRARHEGTTLVVEGRGKQAEDTVVVPTED